MHVDADRLNPQASIQAQIQAKIAGLGTKDAREIASTIVNELVSMGHSPTLEQITAPNPDEYERTVVSMEAFLSDSYFLGDLGNLTDTLREDLIALFDIGHYVEAVVDGAIGWGKSTFVSIAMSYMIYQMSCSSLLQII